MSDDLTPAGAAAVRLALSKVALRERAERAEAAVERVRAALPDECWVTRVTETRCTDLIGGSFDNATKWTEAMCCLPCLVLAALDGGEQP